MQAPHRCHAARWTRLLATAAFAGAALVACGSDSPADTRDGSSGRSAGGSSGVADAAAETGGSSGSAADGGTGGSSGSAGVGGSSSTDADTNPTVRLTSPDTTCETPCTFKASVTGPITHVRYEADGQWSLGQSSDAASDYAVTYDFSTVGVRSIAAIGLDAHDEELARDERSIEVTKPTTGAKLGVWLWYIEGTGMTHAQLASKLAGLGVKRIFVKVADGPASCSSWPELCDQTVPQTYHTAGLEVWAWSYNYPGSTAVQADALYQAAQTGYDGYVLDIEVEFDGTTAALHDILGAFRTAWGKAKTDGYLHDGWPIYVTTWGNPSDHGMHVEIIDQYVDGHMPQTYLEVWGASYMADATKWVHAGTCEYKSLGADKPVHHIISTEHGIITAAQVNEAIVASGPETSIWRVPGNGTPDSIWDDWSQVLWNPSSFDLATCP